MSSGGWLTLVLVLVLVAPVHEAGDEPLDRALALLFRRLAQLRRDEADHLPRDLERHRRDEHERGVDAEAEHVVAASRVCSSEAGSAKYASLVAGKSGSSSGATCSTAERASASTRASSVGAALTARARCRSNGQSSHATPLVAFARP